MYNLDSSSLMSLPYLNITKMAAKPKKYPKITKKLPIDDI